jgi:hypothetical protein
MALGLALAFFKSHVVKLKGDKADMKLGLFCLLLIIADENSHFKDFIEPSASNLASCMHGLKSDMIQKLGPPK